MRDFAAHRDRNHPDQFVKGENLRPDRIECGGSIVARGVRSDLAKVAGENRLDAVISSAGNREEWEPPQQPRDVVEQNVLDAENQRRPNDRVR